MVTKQIFAAHAVSALIKQTKKFSAITVYLATSADLVTNQAAKIVK
jgi:hypothetical protein